MCMPNWQMDRHTMLVIAYYAERGYICSYNVGSTTRISVHDFRCSPWTFDIEIMARRVMARSDIYTPVP